MNKIYFAHDVDENWGTYISAPNLKEAKAYARCTQILEDIEFIDLRCSCVKNEKGIQKTEIPTGELNFEQLINSDIIWWTCDECGGEDFEFLDDGDNGDTYRCKDCGYIGEAPCE